MTSISNIELEPKKKTADIYTYHSNYYQENKERLREYAIEYHKHSMNKIKIEN